MTTPAYLNALLSVEDRVSDLVESMDIDEKLAQLGAVELPRLVTREGLDQDKALEVVPHGIGQVTRIGATTGLDPAQSAELFNQIPTPGRRAHPARHPSHGARGVAGGVLRPGCHRVPAGAGARVQLGPTTGLGSGGPDRQQLLAVGARHGLAPVLDVARDPRWGRLEETYGEDPVLAGTLGAAYVRALQTEDLSQGVLATGKHFLAHAMSEGGRN